MCLTKIVRFKTLFCPSDNLPQFAGFLPRNLGLASSKSRRYYNCHSNLCRSGSSSFYLVRSEKGRNTMRSDAPWPHWWQTRCEIRISCELSAVFKMFVWACPRSSTMWRTRPRIAKTCCQDWTSSWIKSLCFRRASGTPASASNRPRTYPLRFVDTLAKC